MTRQDHLKLSLVQSNLHWENKKANLEMFSQKILEIEETDIIVLPEMFTTGFTNNVTELAETMEGETFQWMKEKAREHSTAICGSIIMKEHDNYYNRLLWLQADGVSHYYDKKHLFAMAGEGEFYTAGTKKQIVEYKGWKINLHVCYDLRFPVWTRRKQDAQNDYDLLLYVASWPVARVHAWSTLLKARAIENMSYCIGVNRVGTDGKGIEYSGASVVVNCLGEEMATTSLHKEEIINYSIDYKHLTEVREKLPFHKDQDQFKIL